MHRAREQEVDKDRWSCKMLTAEKKNWGKKMASLSLWGLRHQMATRDKVKDCETLEDGNRINTLFPRFEPRSSARLRNIKGSV